MKRCCRGSIRTKKKKEDYSLPAMYISYTPCRAFSDAAFQQPASKGEKKKNKETAKCKKKNAYIVKKKKETKRHKQQKYIYFLKKKKTEQWRKTNSRWYIKKERKKTPTSFAFRFKTGVTGPTSGLQEEKKKKDARQFAA